MPKIAAAKKCKNSPNEQADHGKPSIRSPKTADREADEVVAQHRLVDDRDADEQENNADTKPAIRPPKSPSDQRTMADRLRGRKGIASAKQSLTP